MVRGARRADQDLGRADRPPGWKRRLRILFVLYGIANLLLLPSYGFRIEWLSAPAAVSWLVVLPVASARLEVWFRRLDGQAGRP